MIKILHIARPVAGVGTYIQLLSKYIDDSKFSNQVVLNKNDENLRITNSRNGNIKSYHINLIREIGLLNDLKTLRSLIKIVRCIHPDIIHCHSAKAGILGRLTGAYLKIPTVYTPHAYSYLSAETRFKKGLFKGIEKTFRWLPYNKVLACSESEFKRATEELKYSREKVLLWNNSIEEIESIKEVDILKELPDNFICSIGRPSYQKNTELLIKAIYEAKKQLNEVHLVILGVGFHSPALSNVKRLIEDFDLDDNITLVPWLERAKSLSILKNSQFYISSSRYEGLPYAVIEALALSKACVLTDVDGNRDLVEDKFNGFLTQQNEKDLAVKIVLLTKDQGLREKMSNHSRELFEKNFLINKNIVELQNLYASLLIFP